MKKNILITGGMGNLGSWLVAYFVQRNYNVYVLARNNNNYGKANEKYKLIIADIVDLNSLMALKQYVFDYCIHVASYNEHFEVGYPKKALEINALGTRNILEILTSIGGIKKFIYFSTFHVYGVSSGFIDENTELAPKNDYATSHICAEFYIKQFAKTRGLDYCTLRLTNSYGAPIFENTTKWYLVLNDICKMAYYDSEIRLNSDGLEYRDFIWMGDVCSVSESILSLALPSGEYNLGFGVSHTILELANTVAEVCNARYDRFVEIKSGLPKQKANNELKVAVDKLKSYIDFVPANMFVREINKIFDLLERIDGR